MKPVIKKFKRRPIITTHINDIWGADLLDISKMSKTNNNYTFLLVIIDIYSRYAFVVPLKNKSGDEVLKGLKTIDKTPRNLWVDEGKEFYNSEVKGYCKNNNINMYHTYSGLKSVYAERFNKTLRDLIFEYLHSNNKNKFIDELPKIIEEYNNRFHKSIQQTPYDVYVKGKMPKNKIYMEHEEPNFEIGQYVRKVVVKKLFEKGYTAKWSEDIYIINKIDDSNMPIMYEIKDLKGNVIKGKLYKNQLLKTAFKEKSESNNYKDMEKEGKIIKKIRKEGLGEVVLEREKREKKPNKKYIVV